MAPMRMTAPITAKSSEPGNVEQVHEIPQHLQQRRAHHDAEHRPFAAAQAAAADDGGGNGIELVEVAVRRRGDRVGVEGDDDRRHGGQDAGEHVRPGDDRARADARVARRLRVVADGEEVPAVHRAVEQHPGQRRHHAQQHERHRHAADAAGRQRPHPLEALAGAEAFRGIVGDVAGGAAIEQQAAQA